MIDGDFQVFDGGQHVGYRTTRGFDYMKDGQTVLLRITKHVPRYMPLWMGSLTSEVVPDGPWVIEP